jgi:hypothetical protein
MTAHLPIPDSVGEMYDQFTDLTVDLYGGNLHAGYWSSPEDGASMAEATDRPTDLVGALTETCPGDRLLDVGCGNGKPAIRLAVTRGLSVAGISISRYQVELAQASAADGYLAMAQVRSIMTPDEYRALLRDAGWNLVELRDIGENVRPTYTAARDRHRADTGEVRQQRRPWRLRRDARRLPGVREALGTRLCAGGRRFH